MHAGPPAVPSAIHRPWNDQCARDRRARAPLSPRSRALLVARPFFKLARICTFDEKKRRKSEALDGGAPRPRRPHGREAPTAWEVPHACPHAGPRPAAASRSPEARRPRRP
ncbi:hypothetical protein HPB47_012402 [Ixodes persulcatus]|uniref:Uncharacterized protein n=1 Tax=Ixodes persulcatus TaxID=34615 RepID=A0AC60NTM0_IXOPE|nr:hypothetical protein HPB47_012402 [Ixodes persulcatus]